MTSKINIIEIVKGHIKTLKNYDTGKISYADVFVFFIFPFCLGVFGAFNDFNLNKDLISLLVNFGAIFTALLFSVLFLIYDKEDKYQKDNDEKKIILLKELYYNICYSIVCSVFLVSLCFIHSILKNVESQIVIIGGMYNLKYQIQVITPGIVFLIATLLLNILMIVKRMHTLLTVDH